MNTNINISTINKYFPQNFREKNPKIPIEKDYRSIIISYRDPYFSSLLKSEANIANKISQIPYYSNFFTILEDYEPLNISQLNNDIIKKLQPIEDIQYYLFKYSDKNCINFIDYIYNSTSIKKLIFDIINTFSHILYGLYILNENNICFFDISPQNIVFLKEYREKPVLANFRMSLDLSKINYIYISHILNNLDNFTYQPFEIHILYYFIVLEINTISYSFIEEFCEEYIESQSVNILTLFSENYKKTYKLQCIETMKKYINLSKKEIIDDILERNDKWDIFGISMIFIHIFGSISRVFSLKGTFINKIAIELTKNLHPDSNKRMSLQETLNKLNLLLNEENDWNFIKNLNQSSEKLNQLFKDFSN